MTTMSTVTMAGNLTRDPEIRYTRDGQAHSSLSLAVTRRWQNRDTQEWEEATAFFDVSCWRELAENVALSLTKGARVVVTGRLEQPAGRPKRGTAGPRWRSWPTTSGPASGSPRPKSRGLSVTTVPTSRSTKWHPLDRLTRCELAWSCARAVSAPRRPLPSRKGPSSCQPIGCASPGH